MARTASVLLALLALFFFGLRAWLPHADGLRGQLAETLGERLDVQLSVGGLRLAFDRLQPTLSLADAELRDRLNGEPLLQVRALRLHLDLSASLRALRPRIDGVTLVGARVELRRSAEGRITLRGLDAMAPGNDPGAMAFFLDEGRFSLTDSVLYWTDSFAAAPTLRFDLERLDLVNHGHIHRLQARARPAGDADTELLLRGELSGPAGQPSRWSGQIDADWRGGDLARVLRGQLPGDLRLATEAVRLTSWNRLQDGHLTESLNRLRLDGLVLRRTDTDRVLELGDVRALGRWRQQADGWQLQVAELDLFGTLLAPRRTRLSVDLQRAPKGSAPGDVPSGDGPAYAVPADPAPARPRQLTASVGTLPIAPLVRVIGLFDDRLPEAVAPWLRGTIDGELAALALHVDLAPEAVPGSTSGPVSAPGPTPISRTASGSVSERASLSTAAPEPLEMPMPFGAAAWRLQAQLQDLGSDGAGPLPPFQGLDLTLDLTPESGSARVSGRDLQLDLRPLMAEPSRLERVAGTLHWRPMPAGSVHVWTSALQADTAELQTVSRVSLCAHSSGASPFIDLHTHITGRPGTDHAAAMPRYLPVGIMHEKLIAWLEQAIVAVRVESGDILFRGRPEAFPFDDQDGRFLLTLRLYDGILDYQPPKLAPALEAAPETTPISEPRAGPASAATASSATASAAPDQAGLRSAEPVLLPGWPRLEEVDATLRLENRSLAIDIDRARLLQSEILAGQVSLPNLWQPHALEVRGQGTGPADDGLRILSETPLAAHLGGVAQVFDVTGDIDLELELGIPLNKALPFRYAGSVALDGSAAATLRPLGLRFGGLAGALRFDNLGLWADDVLANLNADPESDRKPLPLRIGVRTLDGGTKQARTEIAIDTRAGVDRLQRDLPNRAWQIARGETDWRLLVSLDNADTAADGTLPLDLTLRSDLQGLALALPAPLGKPADQLRTLTLSSRYDGRWPMPVAVDYAVAGGGFGALLGLAPTEAGGLRLERAAIGMDGPPARLPGARGLVLGGTLPRVDLDPWLRWVSANTDIWRRRPEDPPGLPLLNSRLRGERIDLGALRWRDLEAEVDATPAGGWLLRFTSADGGGEIELPAPDSNQALDIRLETLDLAPWLGSDASADAGARAKAGAANRREDPRRVGRIALAIDDLHQDNRALGRLRLTTEPVPDGVRLSELSLDGPLATLQGDGRWILADGEDGSRIELRLELQSDDLGQWLRSMGYFSDISGAPSTADLALGWPGGPGALTIDRLQGTVRADIGAGRLTQVEPGVGRMLGVLNLGALRRRLSLDFSDVFVQGYSFDSISGKLTIADGEARIDRLAIKSPTADIRVSGSTDLVQQRFDQSVRVTPKIGTGVALASAVAGGPLVGAAVLLADRVSGGAMDRLGSFEYRVTGPWREPEFHRVAGAGGAQSVPDLFAEQPDKGVPADTARSGDKGRANLPRDDNPFLEGF
ncbi:hypothetical protein F2Q65_01655 [Thiohalocapsa marina]|uniref:YhdP central domain-containing protein n=1 Tax=Thiohalocapsa marina TaxID=424902 RepID=A0A5M8FTX7_9GAMM|nr:AsmA-like C-terminal region-containing protein [Thiohalocapsa marina]KAA6187262.1 hypothetical protein F2Q65_01655 [Thiohalocapsa marina]